MNIRKRVFAWMSLALMLALLLPYGAQAADRYNFVDDPRYDKANNRWGSAADRIDEFLDQAFEYYLEGDNKSAYDCVNNAYFTVYETTGFERQTMTYVSGPRKNAVELEFTTCKAAVNKTELDDETKSSVRTELNKLKAMVREDANKLAAMMDPPQPQTVTTYWLNGEQVYSDPWADIAGDPNAASRYASWAEAYDAVDELLKTVETAYKGRDYEAAADNLGTAFFSVYEESGLAHEIYLNLGMDDRYKVDDAFDELRGIIASGTYKSTAFGNAVRHIRNYLGNRATQLDEKKAAEAAEAAAEAGETAEATTTQADSGWLTALGAFGIIVREGLEAILVIAAIIAYLVKSGNAKSLKSVYTGAILGIVASFVAALILYFLKQAFTQAGVAQELIEGVTALIAVCVLFYVSNWMISKSEAAAWTGYIDSKVQSGVEKRSAFTLAFTAFLSVFREGAEVVLFYQPMLFGEDATQVNMVIWGFLAGCVVLVFVYLAITKLSIKLPVKVFFTATSILMAIMCVAFLGSGIKELSEGGLFECTLRVPGVPENDVVQVLGIYPFLETLVPQLILSIILLITFMVAHYRGKLAAVEAKYRQQGTAKA